MPTLMPTGLIRAPRRWLPALALTLTLGLVPGLARAAPRRLPLPLIVSAGMSQATQFTASVAGASATVRGSLWLDGRALPSTTGLLAGSHLRQFRFDLAAARVPRFRHPARYRFCVGQPCREGTILLPLAVIHGVLGDLSGLMGARDPYPPLLAALRREGYSDTKPYPTLAYISYPSAAALLSLLLPGTSLVPGPARDGVAAYAARYLAPGVRSLLAGSYAARVDLVGHSMGGLIARAYLASPSQARLVHTAILLGTPNQGSAATFETVGARLLLPETARDLLPTYPYLRDSASGHPVTAPLSNTYLAGLNRLRPPAGVRIICLYGRALPTDSVLLVRGTNLTVTGSLTAPGDGTVTAASARLPGAEEIPLAGTTPHQDLPRDAGTQRLIARLLAPATAG
jgi:pimeloyl-ACP methyl ester carboxylesterase